MTDIKKLMRKKNVKGLIKALKDEDSRVREKAAVALAGIGDPRAVEPLFRALNDENETYSYQRIAAVALGILGDPRALEPTIRALEDELQIVRERAAKALGNIGDPRAVEPLIRALEDRNYRAAEALGKIGDPRAVEPLIRALKHNINGAAEALGEIGDPRAFEPLFQVLCYKNETDSYRGIIAVAIGKIGNPFLEPLIRDLNNGNPFVREKAAKILGWMLDPRAVGPLNRTLNDDDAEVREAAAMALEKIKESGVK